MLILSRKAEERILIGDDIVVTVVKIGANTVRIGVTAPKDVRILRQELLPEETDNDDAR
jgi:carbon storage regulator